MISKSNRRLKHCPSHFWADVNCTLSCKRKWNLKKATTLFYKNVLWTRKHRQRNIGNFGLISNCSRIPMKRQWISDFEYFSPKQIFEGAVELPLIWDTTELRAPKKIFSYADKRWCRTKFPTMMTSLNGNIFRVVGYLCGEFTGHRWITRTRASDVERWCFLWSASEKRLSKQSWGWWFETLSRPLWRYCNDTICHW